MRRATGILAGLLAAMACCAPAAGASTAGAGIAYITGSGPSVWVATASGGHAHKLGAGVNPVISPNGLTVAASRLSSHGGALTLYSVDGGAASTYFSVAQQSATPLAWSPDSRYLAVALSGVQLPSLTGYGLAIIDTQTGTERMIAGGVIDGATFEPGTSDTLAYGRAPSLDGRAAINIHTVAPDGTGTKQITHDGRSLSPVWGSRGIAFDHERLRGQNFPLYQIWLMRSDGTHRKQVTHVQVGPLVAGLVPLGFSSDGTRLAAEYEGQDTGIGYSVSVLSGHATQLKVGKSAVSAWGISRSGRSILITVGGFEGPPSTGKVETIPFSGGHAKRLISHGSDPSWNL